MRKKVHLGYISYVSHVLIVCAAGILIAGILNAHFSDPFNSATLTVQASSPTVSKLILVNIANENPDSYVNGFTNVSYFIDYSDEIEKNPDWSSNNSGKWWEPAFDTDKAEWQKGKLAVGYDIFNKVGWIDTSIDPFVENVSPQVHSIMGKIMFNSHSTKSYSKLFLDYDHEGGLIVWLNGKIVYNSITKMPETTDEYFNYENTNSVRETKLRNTPEYVSADISEYKDLIQKGTNTLTFWNANGNVNAETLAAALKLTLVK